MNLFVETDYLSIVSHSEADGLKIRNFFWEDHRNTTERTRLSGSIGKQKLTTWMSLVNGVSKYAMKQWTTVIH